MINNRSKQYRSCYIDTSMVTGSQTIFIIFILPFLLFDSCTAQRNCTETCKNEKFNDGKVFDSCTNLPVLDAHLHWTYCSANRTVQIAYRASQPTPTGWISWGLNPDGQKMAGTQALVAYGNLDGRSMTAYTTQVNSYSPDMQSTDLKFGVSYLSVEYADGKMSIYATIGPLDGTSFNHVWQAGSAVLGKTPMTHFTSGDNLKSMGTIHFCTK